MDPVKSNVNFSKCAVILLDVAGTTTSIPFVQDTLFNFVSEQAPSYLKEHWANEEVSNAIKLLQDGEAELKLEAATELIQKLTKEKSANVGLKALQGLIYKKGYSDGALKAHVFPDVKAALENWSKDRKVAIYSTGSVESQKLLFGNTVDGDLTPYISLYFDQSVGLKMEASSYTKIASEELSVKPEEILFISDNADELKASSEAGLKAVLVIREGNGEVAEEVAKEYNAIKSFEDVILETSNKRKIEESLDKEAPPTKVPKTEEETSEEQMDTSEAPTEESKKEQISQGDAAMETDCGEVTATTTFEEVKTDETTKVVQTTDSQNDKSTEESKTVELIDSKVKNTEVSENEKAVPIVTAITEPIVNNATEPIVKEAPEPIVKEAPEPIVKDTIEPVVNETTEPIVKEATEPIVSDNSEPIVNDSKKPASEKIDVTTNKEDLIESNITEPVEKPETIIEPVVDTKAQSVVETKAEPVVETKAEPVVETKAEPVVETKAKPVVETKAEPVVETKAEPVVETKAEPVVETKAESVVETKTESVVETKVESAVETNAESVTEKKMEPEATKEPIEEVATTNGSTNAPEDNKTENNELAKGIELAIEAKEISLEVKEVCTETKEVITEVAEEAVETPKETQVSAKTEAVENEKESSCDNKVEIAENDIIVSDVKNGEMKNGDCLIEGVKKGEEDKKSVDDNAGNEIKVKSLEPSVGSPAVSIEV